MTIVSITVRPKPPDPRIDWSNPISRSLWWCLPFAHDPGPSVFPIKDAVGGVEMNRSSTDPNFAVAMSEVGPVGGAAGKLSAGDTYLRGTIPMVLGYGFTVLLWGRFGSLGQHGALWSTGTANPFAVNSRVQLCVEPGLIYARSTFNGSMFASSVLSASADDLDGWSVGAMTYEPSGQVRVFFNGRFGPLSNSQVFGPHEFIALNGRPQGGSVVDQAEGVYALAAVWRRVLDDQELQHLATDPASLFVERQLWAFPLVNKLPCLQLPVSQVEGGAIDESETPGPLVVAAAIRRPGRMIELPMGLLRDDELAAIEECWGDGIGTSRPFWIQLPDGSHERVVFEGDTLVVNWRTARDRGTSLQLIVVTTPGEV